MANQEDMPDQEIAFGTAAKEPEQPAAAPDMNRYWYPPGKTEPELRPEVASTAVTATEGAQSEATAEDSGEEKPKRGKLPDDFPHVEMLREAGITTFAKAKDLKGDYSSIDGIGEARGHDIDAALGE